MKQKNIVIIIITIIILFIMFFLLIKEFGLIEVKMPTGYVDIFDVNFIEKDRNEDYCNCDCNNRNDYVCSNCNKPNINNNSYISSNQTIGKDNNYVGSQDSKLNLQVYDEQIEYTQNTELNIFKHKSYYVKNDVIAPGTENSYQFVVRNNNNFPIIYKLQIEENNPYSINMKYKLKINGKYVHGNDTDWVTVQDLLHDGVVLANNSYNVYTLDWKWFESKNEEDTKIGTTIEANYNLNVNFFVNRYE